MTRPIIIKFGGSLLEDASTREGFLQRLASEWKIQQDPACQENRGKVILVHGGGKEITKELERRRIPARFEEGRRYTDEATIAVVEEVLSRINQQIISQLKREGAEAYSVSGKTSQLMRARPIPGLGLVGMPSQVDQGVFARLLQEPGLPVFYSVAMGQHGESLNVNADDFAQELAIACQASQLIFMTDTGGVRDHSGRLIELISAPQVETYIAAGTITGGMAVKARACLEALRRGVSKVTIAHQVNLATTLPPHAIGTSFVPTRPKTEK